MSSLKRTLGLPMLCFYGTGMIVGAGFYSIIGKAAALLLPLGKLETVASLSSFATMIAFFSVNIALIVLRFSQSSKKRAFRVPLSIGKFPILPLFGALISLVLLTQFELKVYLIGVTLISISSLGFMWAAKKQNFVK